MYVLFFHWNLFLLTILFFLIIWVNLKYFSHESTRTLLYVILVGRKRTFHAYLMCSEAHILTLVWCKNSLWRENKCIVQENWIKNQMPYFLFVHSISFYSFFISSPRWLQSILWNRRSPYELPNGAYMADWMAVESSTPNGFCAERKVKCTQMQEI